MFTACLSVPPRCAHPRHLRLAPSTLTTSTAPVAFIWRRYPS